MANLTNITQAVATQTIAQATAHTSSGFLWVIAAVISRFWELVSAPFVHTQMQWIIIPLILTFFLTEFYFFRHTDEELGWNAALVNSLVLVFVAIDLTKTVFHDQPPLMVAKLFGQSLSTGENLSMFLVIIFIGCLGFGLAAINYFHLLPRKIAFILSSHPPINFIAYFAIVMVYSTNDGAPLPLDSYTVAAAVILFTILMAIIFMLQRVLGSRNLSLSRRN